MLAGTVMSTKPSVRPILNLAMGLIATLAAQAAIYEVGPGRPHATPTDVPWESLNAGDIVRIHWRPAAYRDKWVICRQPISTM